MNRDDLKPHRRIRSPSAKLTEEIVRGLLGRRPAERGDWHSAARVEAKALGVSVDTVKRVWSRLTWAHVRLGEGESGKEQGCSTASSSDSATYEPVEE